MSNYSGKSGNKSRESSIKEFFVFILIIAVVGELLAVLVNEIVATIVVIILAKLLYN